MSEGLNRPLSHMWSGSMSTRSELWEGKQDKNKVLSWTFVISRISLACLWSRLQHCGDFQKPAELRHELYSDSRQIRFVSQIGPLGLRCYLQVIRWNLCAQTSPDHLYESLQQQLRRHWIHRYHLSSSSDSLHAPSQRASRQFSHHLISSGYNVGLWKREWKMSWK